MRRNRLPCIDRAPATDCNDGEVIGVAAKRIDFPSLQCRLRGAAFKTEIFELRGGERLARAAAQIALLSTGTEQWANSQNCGSRHKVRRCVETNS
jgi:hypothetical protein